MYYIYIYIYVAQAAVGQTRIATSRFRVRSAVRLTTNICVVSLSPAQRMTQHMINAKKQAFLIKRVSESFEISRSSLVSCNFVFFFVHNQIICFLLKKNIKYFIFIKIIILYFFIY